MAENIKEIAGRLGAEVVGQVPETGSGAFGAARLAHVVDQLQARLKPGQGLRAGRPTVATWEWHPNVLMSQSSEQRLIRLAEKASASGRKVSPMQLAAQILEAALESIPET